jgi:hypothetical protein
MKNLYLVIVLFILLVIVCLFQQQNEGFQCKKDPSNSDIFQKYQAGHRENNNHTHLNYNHHTYAANDIDVCEKKYGTEYCNKRNNANYGSNKNDNYAMLQDPYFGKLEGDSALGFRYAAPVSATGSDLLAKTTDKGFYSPTNTKCNVGLSGISSCNVKASSVEDCRSKIPDHHKAYMGEIAGVGFRNNDYPIDKCKNTCIFYSSKDIRSPSVFNTGTEIGNNIEYRPLFDVVPIPTTAKAGDKCEQGVCAEETYTSDKYFKVAGTDINSCLDEWYNGKSELIDQENKFYNDKGKLPDIYAVGVDKTQCKYYHSKDSSTRISGTDRTDKWLTHDLDSNYYTEKRCSLIVASTINKEKPLYLNVIKNKEGKNQAYIKGALSAHKVAGTIGDYGEMELSENEMIFNIKTEKSDSTLKYYLLTEDNNFYVGIEQYESNIKVVLRKMKISFKTEKITLQSTERPAQIELHLDTDDCFEGLNKYILKNDSTGDETADKTYGVSEEYEDGLLVKINSVNKAVLEEDKPNLQFIINEK